MRLHEHYLGRISPHDALIRSYRSGRSGNRISGGSGPQQGSGIEVGEMRVVGVHQHVLRVDIGVAVLSAVA